MQECKFIFWKRCWGLLKMSQWAHGAPGHRVGNHWVRQRVVQKTLMMGNYQGHLCCREAPPVSITVSFSCGPTTCVRSHKGLVLRSTLDCSPPPTQQKAEDWFLFPATSKKKKKKKENSIIVKACLWLFFDNYENRFYIDLWVNRQPPHQLHHPLTKTVKEGKKAFFPFRIKTAAVKYGIPPFAIKLLTKTKPKPKPCQIGGALINAPVAQDDSCGGRRLSLIWASCQGADCQRGGKLEQLDDGWFMACDKRACMARVVFTGFPLSAAYCNRVIFC